MEPGAMLRELRVAAKLTATAVAEAVGIDGAILSRIESGQREVAVDEFTAILGVIHAQQDGDVQAYREKLAEFGLSPARAGVTA